MILTGFPLTYLCKKALNINTVFYFSSSLLNNSILFYLKSCTTEKIYFCFITQNLKEFLLYNLFLKFENLSLGLIFWAQPIFPNPLSQLAFLSSHKFFQFSTWIFFPKTQFHKMTSHDMFTFYLRVSDYPNQPFWDLRISWNSVLNK